jgi:hypothetical protein
MEALPVLDEEGSVTSAATALADRKAAAEKRMPRIGDPKDTWLLVCGMTVVVATG